MQKTIDEIDQVKKMREAGAASGPRNRAAAPKTTIPHLLASKNRSTFQVRTGHGIGQSQAAGQAQGQGRQGA